MKKFWIIYAEKNSGLFLRHETLEAASDEARRMAASNDCEYFILEAVAKTKRPVPPIELITL